MKKISKISALALGAMIAGSVTFSSCTDSFQEWNVNPDEVTPDMMEQDNLKTGALYSQMQRGIFIVGANKGGTYQIHQMLNGDNYAGYIANIKDAYDIGNRHHDHYAMISKWYTNPFDDTYPEVMQPWNQIYKSTEEGSMDRAMATVLKVFGMNRITDKYGPIPYSQFGTAIAVPYDSQEDVYNQFFAELDEAISVMQAYVDRGGATYLARYDNVYSGSVSKWLKFANTLRLRLAMRISYVDPAKATAEAQKAIDSPAGFMTSSADDAIMHNGLNGFNFVNPIYEVTQGFNDMRMSATIECYLKGYNDPRLAAYFLPAGDGEYHGMRNGMTSNFTQMGGVTSPSNFKSDSDLPWMKASEAYFLLAEAKLRLGVGTRDVKDLYEQGIRTSFECNGIGSGVDAYIANTENVPATTWVNPINNSSVSVASMVSALPVAWDDADNAETKLERIMIQKWIALYPDGQEAWSEMRRTGYPGWVRINTYSNASGVANNDIIRRIQFSTTEFSNNSANVQEAIRLLGGQDNAGTHLWWDCK